MKKIILSAAILLSCFTAKIASAQVSIGLGINIGSQPDWGPVGYDHVNYYYMPDIDAYYDVPAHSYVYYENNVWVHRRYLPVRYRNYNIYNGYKVVVNEPNPWVRHAYYRDHYYGYRGRHDQVIIRNSRDVRYANHWRGDNRYVTRTVVYRDRHDNGWHGGNPGRGGWHGDHGPGHGPGGQGPGGHGHH
ncbi:hypothetical protein LX99_03834 [Mucilaginibacter oryzae]|uniref:YXWGXW repeat-containing protein n=1 Tax=Mucilaginibacter oryzae TaxID=468058 RepID=A0A316H5N5_9SPHI|nr:hypothetical protein [Mucilaginibacter oryzae]PWK75340.1 hypothetical protein LX99_03834 [Mucilaginibacter oryzae]